MYNLLLIDVCMSWICFDVETNKIQKYMGIYNFCTWNCMAHKVIFLMIEKRLTDNGFMPSQDPRKAKQIMHFNVQVAKHSL